MLVWQIMNQPPHNKRIALSHVQRLIGRLMLQSKTECPCFYLETAVDLTDVSAMRKPLCRRLGIRITTNDFFLCAIARAVARFPLMAGKLDPTGQFIDISPQIGLGFAVSAPQGLVVPVIKNVSEKSLPQIAEESDKLLKKARSNKLMPDDLYGENIVLSGLGMYGVTSFLAIAPPGTTGIISIGNVNDTIVVTGNGFVVRKKMSVSLAVDGRIVNEVYAAGFLQHIIDRLEHPQQLLTADTA